MNRGEMLGGMHPDQRAVLKRMAVNVVALLPADEDEALAVLDYAQVLVTDFLSNPDCAHCPLGRLAIVKASC